MTVETKAQQDYPPGQDADGRSYEAPALAVLGTVGQLASANELSIPPDFT